MTYLVIKTYEPKMCIYASQQCRNIRKILYVPLQLAFFFFQSINFLLVQILENKIYISFFALKIRSAVRGRESDQV